ncbi:kinase-like protein [Gigaspora margarita]|uniref:Kinase-like protein n=1 Tax=Gigaspora margarita TaxID=4874 RepID=A0A8H4ALZ1_GIGMA|nr:kinase-like protein [Gigaspora margarita]
MILQFANNGDLQCYLRNHFLELDWATKIRMAKEISSGINYLHKANLVHRDLLSSGVPPFKNIERADIFQKVISGERETPIDGTPIDFMKLYHEAWNNDPNLRPDIAEIRDKLNHIQMAPVYHSNQNINEDISSIGKSFIVYK